MYGAVPATAGSGSRRGSRRSRPPRGRPRRPPKPKFRSRSRRIDKTNLALPEPRRVRDREHVHYVAKYPCLICVRQSCDAHHLRFRQSRALGRVHSSLVSRPSITAVHRCSDEITWWRSSDRSDCRGPGIVAKSRPLSIRSEGLRAEDSPAVSTKDRAKDTPQAK